MWRECHQYIPVCCSVLQCVAVCYSVLQCAAVCCSVKQCFAVCCRVLQCLPRKCCVRKECRHCVAPNSCVLRFDSVCSSVLQCITVRCSVLQHSLQEQRYMKGISSVCRACGIVCCIVRCFNIYMYGLWLYYARVSRGYHTSANEPSSRQIMRDKSHYANMFQKENFSIAMQTCFKKRISRLPSRN